jgi:hypothetical protein
MPELPEDPMTRFLELLLSPRPGVTEIQQSTPGAACWPQTDRRNCAPHAALETAEWLKRFPAHLRASVPLYTCNRAQSAAAVRLRGATRAVDLAVFSIPPTLVVQDHESIIAVWVYASPVRWSTSNLSGLIARRLRGGPVARIPIPKGNDGRVFIPLSEAQYDPAYMEAELRRPRRVPSPPPV